METILWFVLLILVSAACVWIWHTLSNRAGVAARLSVESSEITETVERERLASEFGTEMFGVRRWLFLAGFRNSVSVPVFWGATGCLFVFGVAIWWRLQSLGTIETAADFIRSIPGGVGNVMVPFVLATPWFLIAVLTLIPTLIVRSVRRKRVLEIEQDLPLMLDLLNTLSQAGVGFDAALDQVLAAGSSTRPLNLEMRSFQADNLAGRSRIESLKRLMRRIEVPIFSTFISAIMQAEQVGAGIGDTLTIQAKEMRARRREKATAAAMAVPTLLVVPMVVGFLPGIFVVLLGPMLYQAFGAMGQTLRGVTGQ